jgi:hypothetical protein
VYAITPGPPAAAAAAAAGGGGLLNRVVLIGRGLQEEALLQGLQDTVAA